MQDDGARRIMPNFAYAASLSFDTLPRGEMSNISCLVKRYSGAVIQYLNNKAKRSYLIACDMYNDSWLLIIIIKATCP